MIPDATTLLVIVILVALVGMLIGSIGVGGVILVPALTWATDISVHLAISAAMFSYLFSGLLGAYLYSRKGSIQWSSGIWLAVGAMPGAYLGSKFISGMPDDSVKLVIAAFVIFAGINTLIQPKHNNTQTPDLSAFWLIIIGVLVGISSAMTGTGGPLLLVPLLMWLKWPVLTVVGLSQFIQLPISLLATLGNVMHGSVDFKLGAAIAAVMVIGVAIGANLAHRLPAEILRKFVGMVLGVVGGWMLWQSMGAFA
ncbi:hypothetical protein AB833_29410 [Chromatiales bacterium (ex Bugula neritina AB1)]|nr:hypothetical protein AB833_29410 [Chromatiales bacterium (ex Bugula neritina AB1)]